VFVGIDWASREHELCVVDKDGVVVERFGFAHSERGIGEALRRLSKLGSRDRLPVVIERPDGLLVSRLLGARVRRGTHRRGPP
jgi:Transposase